MKRTKWAIGLLTAFLCLFIGFVRSQSAQNAAQNTIVGEQKTLGNGTVRTWLRVDPKTGEPSSLGVTLTEKGLEGLPGDKDSAQTGSQKLRLMDGGPNNTFEYELKFPAEAAVTAFNHMGFNWNPEGHGPRGVFTKAHFDVHFYMATTEYRHEIHVDLQDADPTFIKTSNLEPPAQFLPPDYKLAPNTAEPRMGSHYADVTSPELKPGNFGNIFLIGAHGGNILFWEPMITREYLLKKPQFTGKLKLPEAYPVSGYYPTSYSVMYDAAKQEYNIALDGLTFRLSSYPRNVYGVDPCVDTRVAQIISKFKRVPNNPALQRCLNMFKDVVKSS